MVIGSVIIPFLGASVPVERELVLTFLAAKPVEAGIHHLHLLLEDGVVDHDGGSGVVSFYGVWRLWPSHFNKFLMKRYHFLYSDGDSTNFSIGFRIHNKIDDLCNGEDGTVETW